MSALRFGDVGDGAGSRVELEGPLRTASCQGSVEGGCRGGPSRGVLLAAGRPAEAEPREALGQAGDPRLGVMYSEHHDSYQSNKFFVGAHTCYRR